MPSVFTLKRLFGDSLRNHLPMYFLGFICSVAVAAATSGFALTMKFLVNDVFVEKNVSIIVWAGLAVFGLSVLKGFGRYFQTIIMGRIRRSMVTSLQIQQFEKLMQMDYTYFKGAHPSKYTAKIMFCGRAAGGLILTIFGGAVRDALTLLGLIVVMVVQDPLLSLVSLFVFPIIYVLVGFVVRKVKNLAHGQSELVATVAAKGTEAVHGIQTVKSFQLEEKAISEFRNSVKEMEKRGLEIARVSALSGPVLEIMGGFLVGCFVVYAAWQNLSNGTPPGELVAFIAAFMLAYEPAKSLARINVQVQKQLVAVDEMYELLDAPVTGDPVAVHPLNWKVKGSIGFSNVSLRMANGRKVLKDISFSLAAGDQIALVGRSGAGKTTIVNALLGLIPIESGKITIDGRDISSLAAADVRANISLISQDVFLFEDTIRENIRNGRPTATDAEVEAAAEKANVTAFADDLAAGLDTVVDANSGNLSGGQKQRIAIARALLKDTPIIIYDEATSALDGESERKVLDAAFADDPKKTIIIIAHRISTIRHAKRAILLDRGEIIATGTHDELEIKSDLYRTIFHIKRPVLGIVSNS